MASIAAVTSLWLGFIPCIAFGAQRPAPPNLLAVCLEAMAAEGLSPDLVTRGSAELEDPLEHLFQSRPDRRQTFNATGFESTRWDYVSRRFVDFAAETRASHPLFLDVGTAFGRVAIAAAEKGALVVANDLDPRHLDEMLRALPAHLRGKIALYAGAFPEQIHFAAPLFRAIRISRVLHFFSGERIVQALKRCFELLEPGGKLYIVAATPHLAMLRDFLPEFERRQRRGDRWPGYIDDLHAIYPAAVGVYPKSLNVLDPVTLMREILAVGFDLESSEWLANPDAPKEQALDGRELVGAVAVKP